MTTMKITGNCHCGEITYQADVDPDSALICHCTDCQEMSGSVFRTIIYAAEHDFQLLSGTLKSYIKTADSGARRAMMFCGNCGSHIYATSAIESPKEFGIRLGTVTQRANLKPRRQYYCESGVSWLNELETIEHAQ